ncbi:MAG: hypothetical protein ACP5I1_03960, partial [Candidatus Hinthialibacter sp.]
MKKTIIFQTNHLHLDEGEIVPAQVRCAPERPLEIKLGKHPGADISLPDDMHIALGRVDTHVHFRESAQPAPEEFEADELRDPGRSYEETIEKIQ